MVLPTGTIDPKVVSGQLNSALSQASSQLGSAQGAIAGKLSQAQTLATNQLSSASLPKLDVNNLTNLARSAPTQFNSNSLMSNLSGTPGEKSAQFKKLAVSGGVPGVNIQLANNPVKLVSGKLPSVPTLTSITSRIPRLPI